MTFFQVPGYAISSYWIFILLGFLYYNLVLTRVSSVDFLVARNVDEQYWRSCSPASDWYRNHPYSCKNCEEKSELSPQTIVV